MTSRIWRLLILMLGVCHPIPGFAADVFNNGGGLSEANLAFAWQNAERLLGECLADAVCSGDTADQELMAQLRLSMAAERATGGIKTLDPATVPGFFDDARGELTAKSGTAVGDMIFFNVEKIYFQTGSDVSPCGLGRCFGILTAAMATHHGFDPFDAQIVALSERLATRLAAESREIHQIERGLIYLTATVVSSTGASDQLLIGDGASLFDLSNELRAAIAQRIGASQPMPRILLRNIRFSDFHEDTRLKQKFRASATLIPAGGGSNQTLPLTIDLTYAQPSDHPGPWFFVNGSERISLDAH